MNQTLHSCKLAIILTCSSSGSLANLRRSLQLVAADLRAPAANETAATSATNSANSSIAGGPQSVTSADHLHSMPSTAKTGDMLNNGISAGEAQFPYVPLESAWVMEDQTLNWLSADLGQSLY